MSERYHRLGTSALGRGFYGYVYAAWDSKESRTVAIKVQKSESDEAVREMMFFQSIPSHKHLLKVLDTFEQHARLYLVFEYLNLFFGRRVSQSGRSIARGCRQGLFLPGAAGSRPFALTPGGAS